MKKRRNKKLSTRVYLKRRHLGKYGNLLCESHELLASELKEMQKTGGGINIPLSIMDIFYIYLQEKHRNQNNIEAARNTAHVFACLCNEFPLMVRSYKIRDWFFLTDFKWKVKYKIGDRTRERSIELLKEMRLIDCKVEVIRPKPIFRVTLIKINLEALKALKSEVKSFRSPNWKTRWSEYQSRPENNLSIDEIIQQFRDSISKETT